MLAMTIFWEVYYNEEEQKWFCKDVNKKVRSQSLHYAATRSDFVEIVGHICENHDKVKKWMTCFLVKRTAIDVGKNYLHELCRGLIKIQSV